MNIKSAIITILLVTSLTASADDKKTLEEKITFFSKSCMKSTTSASSFLNKLNKNKDKPKKANPFRKNYYFAKDTNNSLAKRNKAINSALETCNVIGNIHK